MGQLILPVDGTEPEDDSVVLLGIHALKSRNQPGNTGLGGKVMEPPKEKRRRSVPMGGVLIVFDKEKKGDENSIVPRGGILRLK